MSDGLNVISSTIDFGQSIITHSQKKATIKYLNDKHSLKTDRFSYSQELRNFKSIFSIVNIFNQSSRLPDTSKIYYTGSIQCNQAINNITLSTSVKVENEANSKSAFSYDLIIKCNKYNNLISSFTFSQNYKKPNFNDLFWEPFGDPSLETEFSKNYYIKNHLLSKYGVLNLDAHYIFFDNLISWRPMAGTNAYWIPENISSAKSYGLDLSYKSNIYKGTSVMASYTLSITENYNTSLSHDHQGKGILGTPNHSATFNFQKTINNCKLQISTKLIGNRIYRYSNIPTDDILPAYFTTNFSYNYKFPTIKKLNAYILLKTENIFKTQYQSVFGFPVPGRSCTITITVKEKL